MAALFLPVLPELFYMRSHCRLLELRNPIELDVKFAFVGELDGTLSLEKHCAQAFASALRNATKVRGHQASIVTDAQYHLGQSLKLETQRVRVVLAELSILCEGTRCKRPRDAQSAVLLMRTDDTLRSVLAYSFVRMHVSTAQRLFVQRELVAFPLSVLEQLCKDAATLWLRGRRIAEQRHLIELIEVHAIALGLHIDAGMICLAEHLSVQESECLSSA